MRTWHPPPELPRHHIVNSSDSLTEADEHSFNQVLLSVLLPKPVYRKQIKFVLRDKDDSPLLPDIDVINENDLESSPRVPLVVALP